MILQSITVINLGKIEHFSYNFTDGLNVLHTRYADEIAYALQVILNHKNIPPLPQNAVRADSRIEADILMEDKKYKIIAMADVEKSVFMLRAYDDKGRDATEEYLYLSDHCYEQDLSEFFEGTKRKMPLRFLQYANEDLYFTPNELNRKTENMANLKVFRAYLRGFINDFQPEVIREGKQYEIVLDAGGQYGVQHKSYCGDVYLSDSEQILFRYLCFLHNAEFWRGFEEIRNLHGVKKPLIIKDFLERLDESIDTSDIIDRTLELGRQTIILTL